jgi:Tol biopolymer transport system component
MGASWVHRSARDLAKSSNAPLSGGRRWLGILAPWLILSWLILPASASSPAVPVPIAIIDFDYVDSSGEAQDQTAKHQALLQAFMTVIRQDLAQSGKYRVVTLSCQPEPCSTVDPAALLATAHQAGADLLLYGGIHKLSTLVQMAKVQMVDLRKEKVVFDRFLTFRGDNEAAWQHTEAFLAADLKAQNFPD